jgi:hypothetical protein
LVQRLEQRDALAKRRNECHDLLLQGLRVVDLAQEVLTILPLGLLLGTMLVEDRVRDVGSGEELSPLQVVSVRLL